VRVLEDERSALAAEIEHQRSALRILTIEDQARDDGRVGEAEMTLRNLVRHASDLDRRLAASRDRLDHIADDEQTDPQAHLRHKHRPEPPLARRAQLVELWSAVSAGVLIASVGVLVVLAPAGWPLWVLLALAATLVIEAFAQHHLVRLLLNATIGLALVTALVLIKDFWQAVIVVGLLAFLVMLVVQNLGELRRA
jgi:hypothetical protein